MKIRYALRKGRVFSLLLALILVATVAGAASAHPLGNFTTNRYSRLLLSQHQVSVLYVVDMAEIPAYKEIRQIDLDSDGQINETERAVYLDQQMTKLASRLSLSANGQTLPLQIDSGELTFPPGQGGLRTLRLEMMLTTDLPSQPLGKMLYRDDNYPGILGWREIVVQPGEDVTLLASTVPSEDLSQALTAYPEGLLDSLPLVSSATFYFEPATSGRPLAGEPGTSGAPVVAASFAAVSGAADPFAHLWTGGAGVGPVSCLCVGWGACPLSWPRQEHCRRLSNRLTWHCKTCPLSGAYHHYHPHGGCLCTGLCHPFCL
jgi:hypothetical protein